MRAISYTELGAAKDVLQSGTEETPAPAAGEVLVALHYSGVNPSDVKSRNGRPGMTKPAFERIIPHSDGAGVITAVGEGVAPSRVGEAVWLWNGQWQRPCGTAASHIALPEQQAVPLPRGVSFETGAQLGIPGLTAAHAVFAQGEVSGKTLFIQGGGGTVGHLAVQLAKWGGAKVIATCSQADMEGCYKAGADHVFDYQDPSLTTKVIKANNGALVDRVIEVEFGLNITTDIAVIKANGTIAVYGSAHAMTPQVPFFEMLFKAVTLDIILVYLLPEEQRLNMIKRLHQALQDKALQCPVAKIFPLEQTAKAHELVENGARKGAVLLDVKA